MDKLNNDNRVRLTKINQEDNKYRFYTIAITKNLFNEWSVLREWGRIGQAGQTKIDWCENLEQARDFVEKKQREKVRRGYVIHL